ncbi:cyclic nucleotide-binding domain-containing protein [Longivirga aurantiaca]|uniref:Cyclic nucleotide-binding domain-containing protein n=1 Tax=Longivirga aurantiaca TaxID=1837743 RepID=A0ABW1T2T1_9ACTN
MRGIDQLLTEHPFFVGLDDATLALMAGCAANRRFAPGEYLFREDDAATTFYVVRHGRVAIEAHRPAGATVVVETVEEGEVLGSSWLVPPHRWQFDARAVTPTGVVVFDGACLRRSCDEDPRLGYELTLRVAQVLHTRLQAARVRLLDLYGTPDASRR